MGLEAQFRNNYIASYSYIAIAECIIIESFIYSNNCRYSSPHVEVAKEDIYTGFIFICNMQIHVPKYIYRGS